MKENMVCILALGRRTSTFSNTDYQVLFLRAKRIYIVAYTITGLRGRSGSRQVAVFLCLVINRCNCYRSFNGKLSATSETATPVSY